jgi:hypothetical protein
MVSCRLLGPVSVRFARVWPGKPIHCAKKKYYGKDDPRITGCDAHKPENNNVAGGHEQHWYENNKESAVHTFT